MHGRSSSRTCTAAPPARSPDDCTALPVVLDSPVPQEAEATISMRVAIDLPQKNDRFGYHGGLALLGTALPTLAIHDDLGWHLDPFVDLGESFYSIVGDYQVTLNVPSALRTPTTGVAVASQTAGPRRITTYVAHDVRDFEWAAGRLGDGSRSIREHRGGRVVPAARRDATGRDDRSRILPQVVEHLLPPRSARSRIRRWTSSSPASPRSAGWSIRRSSSRTRARSRSRTSSGISTGTGSWATTSSRRRGSTSRSPRGRRTCRSADGRSARTTVGRQTMRGSRTTWRTGRRIRPSTTRSTAEAGACWPTWRICSVWIASCGILHDYAQDHWLGVTRTEDFKAAIEAAATADGVAFDPSLVLGHLAGGLSDVRPG